MEKLVDEDKLDFEMKIYEDSSMIDMLESDMSTFIMRFLRYVVFGSILVLVFSKFCNQTVDYLKNHIIKSSLV